jgi:uncharacterized membrane protein YphA (DoxX/SURF4 family)
MKNKILLVVSILVGLMLLNSGLNKLFQYMPMPELTPEQLQLFAAFGTIKWLMPLVAITEIIGGVLIAIPKTRLLGALVTFPVLVGILVHHAVHDPATIIIPGVFLAVTLWIFIENKSKLSQLV